MFVRRFVIGALAALVCACGPQKAPAPPPAPAEAPEVVSIVDPWAASTPAGAQVAAGYMVIKGGREADRLVSASSPRAAAVEIHEMKMDGAVMQMRALPDGVPAPAGEDVTLAPGGTHMMFINIATPFVAGETVPVTLVFEHAGALETTFAVRDRVVGAGHDGGH